MAKNWRTFFVSAGVDPWIVCERALAIAYLDHPDEFPANRDQLAQKLFAPEKLDFEACTLCPDTPSSSSLQRKIRENDGPSTDASQERSDTPSASPLESKTNNPRSLMGKAEAALIETQQGPYASSTLEEIEALTEELEDEMLCRCDVLAIIAALKDPDQSEREIYEMLQRLELMQVSFDMLQETHIGRAVNEVRNHNNASKRVVLLAKRLVRGWKELAQACLMSASDVARAASEGMAGQHEEPGLPSPPMDEAALLTAPMSSMDMFQLWDLDDVTCGSNRTTVTNAQNSQTSSLSSHQDEDNMKKHFYTSKSTRSSSSKQELIKNVSRVPTVSQSLPLNENNKLVGFVKSDMQKPSARDRLSNEEKMEAAKRNLRVNYEREENAKRQRTIQVLDPHDLPRNAAGRAKGSVPASRFRSQVPPRALKCR